MAIDLESGGSEAVSRTDAPGFDGAYTIMGWFQADAVNNNTLFQTRDGNVYYDTLQINGSGNVQGEILYPAATYNSDEGSAISTGVWNHFAMVRADGSTLYGYLNGVLDVTVSVAVSRGTVSEMNIGRLFGAAFSYEAYFDGRVCAVKAWSTVLTATEILTEMRSVIPRKYASLWAWWPMFPGSGERVRDYSVNARTFTENGTLSDAAGAPVPWGMYSTYSQPTIATSGRLMGPLAGLGGLAGVGGLAGIRGGLAG